jgi:hypothetical protein
MRDREAAMSLAAPRVASVLASIRASVLASVALAGCGGGGATHDDAPLHDGGNPDVAGMPPPPALGAQIDRMGRPMAGAALIAAFTASGADPAAQKDAYNRASDPASWLTTMVRTSVTIEDEIKANVAVFDAIDNGMVQNTQTLLGCGNGLEYAGPPGATTYRGAAALFTDDQLYVDTSRSACTIYLALEIEQASAGSFIHNTCGGRTLTYDAVDVMYSVLASGVDGLDQANGLGPRIHGSLTSHTDVKDTFPFLGPPH